jgi:hypothetical protein
MMEKNFVTWLIMLAVLICVTIWADSSFGFQCEREISCTPSAVITPFAGLKEICLCDLGHGKWRRIFITTNDQ